VCARGSNWAWLGAPTTSLLGVMNTLSNRILLVASYCLMCINMTIEVFNHPDAKDHAGSVTGLAFCVVTLVALVWRVPPLWVTAVAVLNVVLALFGAYLIGYVAFSHGVTWTEAPETLVRVYLVVLVPIVAVYYFITLARTRNSAHAA
jgi:uncharacterized membrane-anchored protein YitT (DUF2179 family)